MLYPYNSDKNFQLLSNNVHEKRVSWRPTFHFYLIILETAK